MSRRVRYAFVVGTIVLIAVMRTPGICRAAELCAQHPLKDSEQFVVTRPLEVKAPDMKPEVIGGSVVEIGEWPATMILCSKAGTFCTATAVGQRIVLTAAHCLEGLERADYVVGRFDHVSNDEFGARTELQLGVKCRTHGKYRPFLGRIELTTVMKNEWSADLAVCAVEKNMNLTAYERVLKFSDRIAVHDEIMLVGLGCTESGGGGKMEVPYQGPAPIDSFVAGTYFVHTKRDPDSVQHWAALCSGDSGGAAFKSFSAGDRYVVAIAAISDDKEQSFLTNVTATDMIEFIKDNSNNNDLAVCGLHSAAPPCRQTQ
jgi:hypothetical protein